LFGIIYSIQKPKKRIWPPPKKDSWQFYLTWTFSYGFFIGIILTGLLDFNTFILNSVIVKLIGAFFLILGIVISALAIHTLGLQKSHGLKGKLVIRGPYQHSRNPQYIGIILFLISGILIFNSLLVLINSVLGIFCFLILPFAEEPWLKKQYSDEYKAYLKEVRRFL
jgi:protein-S-isoprenylcysteine O-methyltransferase Ste14